MDRRYRVLPLAFGVVLLCLPVVLASIFFGFAYPQTTTFVRLFSKAFGEPPTAPVKTILADVSHRPLRGPERFVILPSESNIAYRVTEAFMSQNMVNNVVGVTNAIRGEFIVDRKDIRNSRVGPITVDIRTFKSDNIHRDDAIRASWLESSRFPLAEFTPTEIRGLPETLVEGKDILLQIIGHLKLHDVVKQAAFAMTVRLQGNVLKGDAHTSIHMTDFGVQPPSIGILQVRDQVGLEMHFTARRADIVAGRSHRTIGKSHALPSAPGPAGGAPSPRLVGVQSAICGASLATVRGCSGILGTPFIIGFE